MGNDESRQRWLTARPARIGALVTVAAGLGLGVGIGVGADVSPVAVRSAAAVTPRAGGSPALALQNAYVSALRVAGPSVVEIDTASGLGSGIVYDTKGDIVTNAHVVGTETRFSVLLASGQRVNATLVGVFLPDDLAVIRMTGAKTLRPARFADSSKLAVGNIVLAIGSPYGLSGSVTDGIVSSTGRSVSEGNGVLLADTIQTSAPINPGNSGGALVDLSGAVVGIPTLAATSSSGSEAAGIGFAIPSSTVKLIAPQLIKSGKVTSAGRAALGVSGAGVSSGSGTSGIYVASVTANGPAAKAGIVAGDIITSVDGHAVATFTELQSVLAALKPGRVVPVKIVHANGTTATVRVTLGDIARL